MRKAEVVEWLKRQITFLEEHNGRKVRFLRSDRGGEYIANALGSWLLQRGIEHQLTAPYTPQQNGTAEGFNKLAEQGSRALLAQLHTLQPLQQPLVHLML